MVIGGADKPDIPPKHLIDFPAAQNMVPRGDDIRSAVKDAVGGFGQNPVALS